MEAGFSFDEFLKSSAEVSAKIVLAMVDRLGR
jgi:nucleoside phosphorylase